MTLIYAYLITEVLQRFIFFGFTLLIFNATVQGTIITTIGFLKEAPLVSIHGFNVYHKNRLVLVIEFSELFLFITLHIITVQIFFYIP